jgi:hypothetical protein
MGRLKLKKRSRGERLRDMQKIHVAILAAETGLSPERTEQALRDLEDAGYMVRDKGGPLRWAEAEPDE